MKEFGCVLVTGGCGFIGSTLVEMLKDKAEKIVVVDDLTYAGKLSNLPRDPRVAFYQADVADKDQIAAIFQSHIFDTVFHLAAETHVDRSLVDPLKFIQTNVMGTGVLLQQVALIQEKSEYKSSPRFIHVSTDEVYGSVTSTSKPATIHDSLDPTTPYAASKAAAENLVLSYINTYYIDATITRCSNNYGPRQHPEKLLPKLVRCALTGETFFFYGDGSHVRNWIHVNDHCDLLCKIAQNNFSDIINIGTDDYLRTTQFVDLVNEILDSRGRPKIKHGYMTDRKGNDQNYVMSTEAIRFELDWKPSISITEGLTESIDWYWDNAKRWFNTK